MKLLLKKSYFDSLNSTTWWWKNIYLFSASTINCEILYICSAIKKRLFLKIRNILALLIKKNNLSYGLKYVSKKTSAAPAWAGISLYRMERIYSYSSWK